mmetsp:Transcript_6289/g.18983  ORF Transcript_6289/g.18983 Transcript_6289/m.18983 type:complete len:144 (-) Transcript_6289:2432-2863(-)
MAPVGLMSGAAPCLVWSGVILAGAVDARAKFNAKTLTKPVGFDVGRSQNRALSRVEIGLAITSTAAMAAERQTVPSALLAVATTALCVQSFIIRPGLFQRVQMLVEGKELPKSKLHISYLVTEGIKLVSLLTAAHLSLGKGMY